MSQSGGSNEMTGFVDGERKKMRARDVRRTAYQFGGARELQLVHNRVLRLKRMEGALEDRPA